MRVKDFFFCVMRCPKCGEERLRFCWAYALFTCGFCGAKITTYYFLTKYRVI